MQSVSSRIWTRVAESISYGDNHYTTGTPNLEIKDSSSAYDVKLNRLVSMLRKIIKTIIIVSELKTVIDEWQFSFL